jgi:hypothetical protein
VRTAPAGPHFEAAKRIYAELHELEQHVEGADVRRRKASIEASVARLGQLLAEAGFADYGAFMRAALPAEVIARAARLPATYRAALAAPPSAAGIDVVTDACTELRGYLDGLVVNLSGYAATSRELAARSGSLQRLSDDVRLFSLNAQLGAARLDDRGRALSAVAHLLSEHTQRSGPAMAQLGAAAASAVSDIETMVFRVAVSVVQAEMLAVFAHELTEDDHDAPANMAALVEALGDGLARTGEALTGVGDRLAALTPEIRAVLGDVQLLGRLALNGSIEVARLPEATATGELFHEVRAEVDRTRAELSGMLAVGDIVRDLRAAARDPRARALASVGL